MKNKFQVAVLSIVLMLAAIGLVSITSEKPKQAEGSAFSGVQAMVATSSTIQVGPQERKVWFLGRTVDVKVPCAARIISTQGQAVALTFDGVSSSTAMSQLSLTLASGHIQAASTTVVYDSGLYGCNRIGIYGYGATTTVTITETR